MSEPLPITVISTIDPLLRDSTTLAVALDTPGAVTLSYTMGRHSIRRIVADLTGVLEDHEIPLDHVCLNCALREDVIPTLEGLADLDRWRYAVLAAPVGAEPQPVAEALALAGPQLRLASVAAVATLASLDDDVLGADLLSDRGLALTDDDERSVAEALTHQIEYADIVITPDDDPAGRQLLDHIRAADGQHWTGLHHFDATRLFDQHHDPIRAARRTDPRYTEPIQAGTSSQADHGLGTPWTLDLHSPHPFHPVRLMASLERLGAGRLRARGRFWLPTRPDMLCVWDGAGGQLAIGTGGPWDGIEPSTRLVVTGTGNERPRLRNAFADTLLTPAEMSGGITRWVGADDGFDPWLGESAAAA
ncbi:CobW family GTP-binding protein [Phytoactinopolyspora limicola]|uniref:CobW family GTP-binding protein n=1 Tax=Phytoactinopolyspora limicola TaxID=2715536 RepID=UPI001407B66A|nr:GTP-binding protein [Phytoactinopolyspora limicola]